MVGGIIRGANSDVHNTVATCPKFFVCFEDFLKFFDNYLTTC